MTETSGEDPAWLNPATGFPNQGAWSIALKSHQAMTAGRQSGWAYWQFTDGNAVGASTLTDATQRANAAKYVAAKHFCRFIQPNAVRVNASVSSAPDLEASAYLAASNTALTVVVVNSASNATTVQVRTPALPAGLTNFQSFTSGPNTLWVSNSVPIVGGAAPVTVPGYGVCTLFGQTAMPALPPAFIQWPQSTDLAAGSTVRLSGSATGDSPVSFQWFFNNLPIPGANGTSLVLTNVQPFQAGQYAVQVTNNSGSLRSLSADLGVTGQPTLPLSTPRISIASAGDTARLSFEANAGRIYSWLVSTNLSNWTVATQFVSTVSPAQWLLRPTRLGWSKWRGKSLWPIRAS